MGKQGVPPRVERRAPGTRPGIRKIDRLLVLQEKAERNAQAITRLETIWSFVAAGIVLAVATLRDWLFGQK